MKREEEKRRVNVMSDPFIFLEAFMEGIGNGGCMYAEMV